MSFSLTVFEIVQWSIRLAMLVAVLSRPQRPVVALAWIALTMLVPILGGALYLMFGSTRLGRWRARRYAQQVTLMRSAPDRPGRERTFIYQPKIEEAMRPLVGVAESLGGMPILGGNTVELLPHASRFIELLIEDIDRAAHHVHLVYFIFEDDDVGRHVGAALARAAQRGVKCRVLADAAGSFFFFSDLSDRLKEQGVEVHANLPVNPFRRIFQRVDLRNHRKVAVIDGRTAYTGSHNIIRAGGSKRRGGWQDLTARITGPTVHQLQAVFLDDFCFETGCDIPLAEYFPTPQTPGNVPVQVIPTGPADGLTALMRDVIIEALHTARERVIITTPYFVPDESLTTALRLAAARGARVDIVLPRRSDNMLTDLAARAYFGQLLGAGIKIHLNKGGMLHAKTMTVDDGFAMLGSANFDIRSFFLNFELNLLLYTTAATTQLRLCQSQYIADSMEMEPARWVRRNPFYRMVQNTAMLLSPLL